MGKIFKILVASVFLLSYPAFAKTYKVTLNKDNTISMCTYFSSKSVSEVAQKAKELDSRLPSNKPMFLVLDTGGGSINAGLELISNLKHLNRKVHTITLFAASMGFHTVQNLGYRFILRDGTLMTHKAKGMFSGEFPGQIDSRYSYWLRRILRMDRQVVKRTNGVHTLKSYRVLSADEYWCDGEDCIEQGFADATVVARCDETLGGTSWISLFKMMFLGKTIEIKIKKSNCPLITGYLDFSIIINGQDMFDKESTNFYFTEEETQRLNEIVKQKLNEYSAKKVKRSY